MEIIGLVYGTIEYVFFQLKFSHDLCGRLELYGYKKKFNEKNQMICFPKLGAGDWDFWGWELQG